MRSGRRFLAPGPVQNREVCGQGGAGDEGAAHHACGGAGPGWALALAVLRGARRNTRAGREGRAAASALWRGGGWGWWGGGLTFFMIRKNSSKSTWPSPLRSASSIICRERQPAPVRRLPRASCSAATPARPPSQGRAAVASQPRDREARAGPLTLTSWISSSVRFSPSSLATRFRFLKEMKPAVRQAGTHGLGQGRSGWALARRRRRRRRRHSAPARAGAWWPASLRWPGGARAPGSAPRTCAVVVEQAEGLLNLLLAVALAHLGGHHAQELVEVDGAAAVLIDVGDPAGRASAGGGGVSSRRAEGRSRGPACLWVLGGVWARAGRSQRTSIISSSRRGAGARAGGWRALTSS